MKTVQAFAVFTLLALSTSIHAQQTTGHLTGRIVDPQGAAVPGATVTATNGQTGFTRTETTDNEGIYRLAALPVGVYELRAELQGFATVSHTDIEINVGRTHTIDFSLRLARVTEAITVTNATPLIDVASSSAGQVVDLRRIENLPLNGRQFANLAATVPGVGLGFHADPTKGTNYAPFINGGAGRNVNYLVDGGDNNDDTVGGLLQQFPLEAIQEFDFQTQRFKAEWGRSNGGVMNIVTKSGTNRYQATGFEFFRDRAMNALTENEKLAVLGTSARPVKGSYRRHQFGTSEGGPIVIDKVHFFAAFERTAQDTSQTVNTKGLFPSLDGRFPLQYRENIGSGKASATLTPAQYATLRYGFNDSRFPFGAGPTATPDNWGDAHNRFHSINLNHNWVLGSSRLNEFIFQYADFSNFIGARSSAPALKFPNGVMTGGNLDTPQATEQRKYQIRDDVSWHVTGHFSLGHDFKAGVSFISEPRLRIVNTAGKGVVFTMMLANDVNGPVQLVLLSDGDASANIPNKQYGLYFQDDWRVSDRLTVNAGVRWDLVTGIVFDQSLNPNFVKVQAAARAGALAGIAGLEHFGLDPRSDRNNIQPRVGAAYNLRGNGHDVVRGGWGVYTDFGYTASNVLLAALDASGTHFGQVFNAQAAAGLRNPDGSFYRAGQPLSNLASQNLAGSGVFPLQGFWIDPRLQQPYQMQSNIGWSHQLTATTTVSVDYVNSLGRNLNFKPRVNQLIPGTTTRRVSARLTSPLSPNTSSDRPVLSRARSQYNALIISGRRRLSRGIDFTASYTLSRGLSTIGNASDETNTANIQNPDDPFDNPMQLGPNVTTDARHRVTVSAVVTLPGGLTVAPFFMYRSALPVFLIDGRDLNRDGDTFDIPSEAFAAGDFDARTGKGAVGDIGACRTVNCGRGWGQSQLNLRVARTFRLRGRSTIEAIGEVFNLFNAINPGAPSGVNRRVTIPSGTLAGQRDPTLLQPTTFSGDNQRPEQRVGQVGLRFSF